MVCFCLRLMLWLYLPFLIVLVAFMGAGIYFLALLGWGLITCGLLLLPLIILTALNMFEVLWAFRVLLVRLREKTELEVRLPNKKYTKLFDWVADVARRRRVPAPQEIWLAADTVAAVFENRHGSAVLLLGGPAVACFSQTALAGVVAHELGHIAAGDIALARRSLRPVLVMDYLDEHFRGRRWSLFNPFLWPMLLYHLAFRWLRALESRQGEYAADRYSVAHAGKEITAAALIHATVTERLPWVRLSSIAESAAVHTESLRQLFTEQMRRARHVDPSQWEEACRKELAVPTGPFDSHPALRERLKGIGVTPKKALKLALDQQGEPARDLFPDWEELEKKLSERVVDLYREVHLRKMEAGQILLGRPIER